MFLSFREEVEEALESALSSLDLPTEDLGIEEPPEDVDAVLASSAAFRLASEVGAPPPKIAADVADAVDASGYTYIGEASPQGPYVNFTPTPDYYTDTLAAADEDFGRLPDTGEDLVVEHTSANPTGPVHVGRARNPIVGDAVAHVLSYAGHDVDVHYYVNDAGRQMAVFTWAYETFDEEELESEPERDRIEYDLVRYYRKGNEFLENADREEVEEAEAEIQRILKGLEEGDEETKERVETVVDQVLGGMKECLKRLPAEFDEFVKETRFMPEPTQTLVEELKELDEAVYEEGAWQLDLSEYGIEKNFVFLRSDGTSLYATRDLAHHQWKFDNYDRAVTVLGEDHKLQARQLETTLELLGEDTSQLDQVLYSYVNLPEGKMSTRAGTGIDLDDLLDEAVERAREEVEKRLDDRIRGNELDEDDVERIAHQVGIGAVRYDIVSKQPTKAITFDWEDALDFEGQSAPYVQYAHARCYGILDEVEQFPGDVDASVLDHEAEIALVRKVARFPGVVEEAAEDFEPHQVATYVRELADAFNQFYRKCPVLKEDVDPARRDARLAVVAATRHALHNGLHVLGIDAPESM
ncbi:arginine--tRNA ligase [Halospeciosus flavus]|uniref:Arginine--tRNA ligase n=1 Tax=Halospeciosus flavus TaxID=3032283 RepID=A0ABD5Z7S2_9EURY|nr:arginine--tRNA ligase [Halospeciosus flavus]